MTVKELISTLENRRKGLGYKLWKQANLVGATMSRQFPKKPEEASPELYPPKKTIAMPDFLKDEWQKKMNGAK